MAERNEKGQFIKGYKGGPGRPTVADEAAYWDALTTVATPERIKKVVEAVLKKAERGDIAAANVILARVLPVTERREHAGSDGGAIRLIIEYENAETETSGSSS